MSQLPSKEEFIKTMQFEKDDADITKYWNKELYRCPRCNEGVKRDYSVQYMSNPPKWRYFCRNCSYSEVF